MPGTDNPTLARAITLAVVTVTYSPGEHLEHFLSSIDGAFSGPTPQVVMADNGSIDGSVEAAAENHPEAELLRTGANLGYGGAINYAVTRLDQNPDFLLISNPDVVFGPGSIDELVAAAHRHPDAGALGPLIHDPDGTVYPSARSVPNLVSGIGHALLGTVWKSNPWTRAYQQAQAEVIEREAGWLSGSCLLVRPAAFESIGGFDDRYFMYMEDVDFGDRLARAGWRNVYVPSAEIVHAKGHAAGKVPELMLPAHHESAYRFFADRHPGRAAAPLRAAMKVGLAARSKISVLAAVSARRATEKGSR
ncbi:Glycosyl transferase family 2 OS=Tsukamurella paurometabola (strain ATCC 8368 / DSM / CCUG 35730/ CIP 100753 / JCM 10117 / KCTC 9821 / NBRC 16120 / NCIMB 702349 / NCTC 13040) OX=521096 GN=Tpau_1063 PE=3 SV=1 [Tsukamurella paurometabola]|uniref:Glycosyl transferase family 2 n=1 Tax=Tsukamurella paurometabola (strain ATCC 8368 / DSM 20162 / CCUG 35730 / CIP 100753 / JCM 10117 / KCTC 9821 / NBRC 16120 / NCIMB 702349 / NCTC 13040) TaxID=521096 RepID=D5UVA5_TSUPD|nr:glycosyltransferase family 2 protein [Tsukamurella paurometabola]ADG77695.1 glycosyl transferase family 2 [Tsukamurella paurometabola DSM 20162]SUP28341.1 dTDP-Rha:alpha-D-GlcNAc-pyrophosphate polyprenol, alpha-3-L-rhamnosyltransferase [Tsukamurella paurometabola]